MTPETRKARKELETLRKKFAAAPTLTAQVRAAMRYLGTFDFITLENLVPHHPDKRIWGVIKQFKKTGEIVSIRPGYYEHFRKPKRRSQLDVIWHLVRSHRKFTTDEIERLSGAKRKTALEYLHCLKNIGCLMQVSRGVWLLVNDPGPDTPVNTANSPRLKKIRQTANSPRLKKIRQTAKTKKEIRYGKA